MAYLAATNSAGDIKAFSPEARIIIMLSNPLDVMYSLYHLRRFNDLEDEPSFEAALAADERGRRPYEQTYRAKVSFSEQVKRFVDAFGAIRFAYYFRLSSLPIQLRCIERRWSFWRFDLMALRLFPW